MHLTSGPGDIVGVDQLELGDAREPGLQCDAQLEASQIRAGAPVDTRAEGDMSIVFAGEVDDIGVLELAEDPPRTTIMATYFRCGQADTARADAAYEAHMVPFMKAEVAAGRITAFGYAKHVSGGGRLRTHGIPRQPDSFDPV